MLRVSGCAITESSVNKGKISRFENTRTNIEKKRLMTTESDMCTSRSSSQSLNANRKAPIDHHTSACSVFSICILYRWQSVGNSHLTRALSSSGAIHAFSRDKGPKHQNQTKLNKHVVIALGACLPRRASCLWLHERTALCHWQKFVTHNESSMTWSCLVPLLTPRTPLFWLSNWTTFKLLQHQERVRHSATAPRVAVTRSSS